MLRSGALQLASLQMVIFTPDHSAFKQALVLSAVLSRFNERFNGLVQALPLPNDVPAEVPRIILSSEDKSWALQAGPARVDCFWRLTDPNGTAPDNVLEQCAQVLTHYVETANVRVGRLALVV